MQTLTSTKWQRSGSSLVWAPDLLAEVVRGGEPVPLRVVLSWMKEGFPSEPPGGRKTVVVGGLQTVLETYLGAHDVEAGYNWLRQNILPLVRAFQSQWDRVGLVFVMDGPGKLFSSSGSDDIVYFGKGHDPTSKIRLTLGIWNGAAMGGGIYELPVETTKEIGGYYVQRVS